MIVVTNSPIDEKGWVFKARAALELEVVVAPVATGVSKRSGH